MSNGTVIGSDDLTSNPGNLAAPARGKQWAMLAGQAASNLIVTSTGLFSAASGGTAVSPLAYWNATFPDDQWVQAEIGTAMSNFNYLILRCSGAPHQLIFLQLRLDLNQVNIMYADPYSISMNMTTMTRAISASSGTLPATLALSPSMAVGDILRLEVVGQIVSLKRQTVGTTGFVQQQAVGGVAITGPLISAASGITSGTAGVGCARGNAYGGLVNWAAGGFAAPIVPPAPPTGSQGAFTVRTT